MDQFLRTAEIAYSKRVSIKRKNGEIDRNRSTYCFGSITDARTEEIMRFLTKDEEAIKYIKRRKNDNSAFIASVDSDCIKFYLDFGFTPNKISMISIELKKNQKIKTRTYTPKELTEFPTEYLPLRPFLNLNSLLVRNDGQKYLRFSGDPPMWVFLRYFPEDEHFFRNVREPTWFQFSEGSCTFYFASL